MFVESIPSGAKALVCDDSVQAEACTFQDKPTFVVPHPLQKREGWDIRAMVECDEIS
jgi:hypothetical protein